MKKFQVLFAMLFVALTFSLSSCSDDATSAPASPFTKSATQPDSYMPYNASNTATYEINLITSGTKQTGVCSFIQKPNYLYHLSNSTST